MSQIVISLMFTVFWPSGGSSVSSKCTDALNMTAKLLEVSPQELKMSLTTRMMSAGGADVRSDNHQRENNIVSSVMSVVLYYY